jgi:hypothetical protein
MASLTYSVRGIRIELLFWKNEPAVNWNKKGPTRSNTGRRWFVIVIWSDSGMVVEEGSKGFDASGTLEGAGRESRRRRVAPRLNDQIVLDVSVQVRTYTYCNDCRHTL